MNEGIKLTFSQIASSDAYQKQAENWAKTDIFIAIIVAIATAVLTPADLGWKWIWVLPVLIVGISLLVAMPTMAVYVFLVSIQSGHMKLEIPPKPADTLGLILEIIKNIWSLVAMCLAGWVSYIFVVWVGT